MKDENNYRCCRKTASKVFIPLTVGGGISSVKDMYNLLRAGADKVSINSAAVRNPKLIEEGQSILAHNVLSSQLMLEK